MLSTSALKVDGHTQLHRTRSGQGASMLYSSTAAGIKKSSVCLQTKFQLVG